MPMTKAEARIVRLMRETGQPLIVSGIDVRKWRIRDPGRLQVGVSPQLLNKPSAYRAQVDGHRMSIRAACSLMSKGCIKAWCRWHIRGRFRLTGSSAAKERLS